MCQGHLVWSWVGAHLTSHLASLWPDIVLGVGESAVALRHFLPCDGFS